MGTSPMSISLVGQYWHISIKSNCYLLQKCDATKLAHSNT